MPNWSSKAQVEKALKAARKAYKKEHDALMAGIKARPKLSRAEIDKLQEKSDAKLKVCADIQFVLDRWEK